MPRWSRKPSGLAPPRTNMYPGVCRRCGNNIPANGGLLVKDGSQWKVEHSGNCAPAAGFPATITSAAAPVEDPEDKIAKEYAEHVEAEKQRAEDAANDLADEYRAAIESSRAARLAEIDAQFGIQTGAVDID